MCLPELLRDLRALQQELDTIRTIHLNQLWGEVAAVRSHHNMLPTQYLESAGFLHDRMVGAHCRCVTDLEEKILGQHQVQVAFNSAIAARCGLSPGVSQLEAAGCNIGMGTDNMSEDMVEVMRTGLFMERVRREDGRSPTPEDALRWATRNGYRAMGVQQGGWLAEVNLSDLITIRTDRPHLVPLQRAVSVFLHQGQASDVQDVTVDHARGPRADDGRGGGGTRGGRDFEPRLGATLRREPPRPDARQMSAAAAGRRPHHACSAAPRGGFRATLSLG